MLFTAHHIPYRETHAFSKIITDYIEQSPHLQSFYAHPPTIDGIKSAIAQKEKQRLNRALLVQELQQQYAAIQMTERVKNNIESLHSTNTFTVCTAHQPNIFTGPLYFIYKIIHAIKLAASLKHQFPGYHFVPVYYMGSEDADLAELNHITVGGKKYIWQTAQTGAVGRMFIDKNLIQILEELKNQIGVEPYGNEMVEALKQFYRIGATIQQATFELVNHLFGQYGLVVLIADTASLKKEMQQVFTDDLLGQMLSSVVEGTSKRLAQLYHMQAYPRDINLFYLKENIRERIIKTAEGFNVNNTAIRFSEREILEELHHHPERFSPNVILRGLFQETILPNIIFIGGGGELAYWLQLKDLFAQYQVSFPVLVLRNSFLLIEKKWQQLIDKLQLPLAQLFQPEGEQLNFIIEREGKKPVMDGELQAIASVYEQLDKMAGRVDITLSAHVAALKTKTVQQIYSLEKKMLRAERKKHTALQHQIHKLKQQLFPYGLQERGENVSGYYAKWGRSLIDELVTASLSLEQQFVVLSEV